MTPAAAAAEAATIHHEVPDLARAAADPGDQLAVGDDRASNSRANETAKKVRHPLSSAERQLTSRRYLHIIAQRCRHAESFPQRLRDRQIDDRLAQVGRAQQNAFVRVNLPGRANADAYDLLWLHLG